MNVNFRGRSGMLAISLLTGCALLQPEREAESANAAQRDPQPAQPTEVTLPELPPEDPAEPPPPEPSAPAIEHTAEPTRGRLSQAAIQRGIEPSLPAFEACYSRALAHSPELRGTINVNFVIAPDGTVPFASALEQGTTLPDNAVIDCVLEEFQKLQFSPPVGGRVVTTYPLSFAPTPGAGPTGR